jgi:hypothetical protein
VRVEGTRSFRQLRTTQWVGSQEIPRKDVRTDWEHGFVSEGFTKGGHCLRSKGNLSLEMEQLLSGCRQPHPCFMFLVCLLVTVECQIQNIRISVI